MPLSPTMIVPCSAKLTQCLYEQRSKIACLAAGSLGAEVDLHDFVTSIRSALTANSQSAHLQNTSSKARALGRADGIVDELSERVSQRVHETSLRLCQVSKKDRLSAQPRKAREAHQLACTLPAVRTTHRSSASVRFEQQSESLTHSVVNVWVRNE